MPRKLQAVRRFGRIVSALGGESRPENPQDMKNLMLSGLSYICRHGYTEVSANPVSPTTDPYAIHGLEYVVKSNGTSEFLSIETRNTSTYPYSINPTTFARTQIGTNTVATGDWVFTSFGDNAYAINPGGAKTVYRHEIGNNADFTALEDTAYTPPAATPNLTLSLSEPSVLSSFTSIDNYSYSGSNTYPDSGDPVNETYNADGSVLLNSSSDDGGGPAGGFFLFEQQFHASTTRDFTGSDYIYINIEGKNYLKYFTNQTTLPQLRIGGVWTNVTDARWFYDNTLKKATWVIYTRGMTLTAVQGIRFRISCKPGRGEPSGAAQDWALISPVMQGGYYLESTTSTQRLWDIPLVGDGITYGVRFTNGGTTVSSIEQETISAASARGFFADTFACPVGGIVRLECSAPQSPYTTVEFLRLDQSVNPAEWKVINTDTTEPFLFQDFYLESQVSGLTTITTGSAPDPVPVFRTAGIRGAFPFKQSMFWLINSGFANIQISRVGDPEELYDESATYGNDLTQPAQYTLADNEGDRPIWGAQAGYSAFIVGEEAAYAMTGDAPSEMSPSRQIPGSRGIAGPYAGTRMRPQQGQWGVAYADPNLNVWFVNSVPRFVDDTSAQPTELSLPVRGRLKQFLFDEQKGEFPNLSISKVQVEFQEDTSSLWVFLGKRAAVYRQDLAGIGWEFYDYTLTTPPGSGDISTCTAYTSSGAGVSTVVRTGWTEDWTTFGNALISDDSYAQASMFLSDETKYLRATSLAPSPLINVSATLDEVRIRIEHSSTGAVTRVPVYQDNAYLLVSGVQVGGNLAISTEVPATDTQVTYTFTPAFPAGLTIANLNAGNIGFEMSYETRINSDHNNPANWTLSVSPSGVTNTTGALNSTVTNVKTVTATYIGPGSPPDHVNVSLVSTATVSPTYTGTPPTPAANWNGTGTIDNGLGDTNTGFIEAPTIDYPGSITVTGSDTVRIGLTAGTGTYVVNQVGSTNVVGTGVDTTSVSGEVTPTFAPWTTATLKVDAMEISACFTVTNSTPGATSGISWDRVAFSPNDRYLAGRSSGQLDLVEWDFRTESYIGGDNRDGGYPMPDWFWESIRMTWEGTTARLVGVQVNTVDPTDPFVCQAKIEGGSFVTGTSTGDVRARWVTFPVNQNGIQHTVRLSGDESLTGIDGIAYEYQPLSRAKPQ